MSKNKSTMEYIKLSENYKINKLIPSTESPYDHIKNPDSPYFISMFKYTQNHFDQWNKTKTLSGIDDNKTNNFWVDFDDPDNLDKIFASARTLCERLMKLGIKEENIQLSFSGNKGIGFIVETTHEFSQAQIKKIAFSLASDLYGFDPKMYDNQRIFRLLFTKNEKTGLYKIPLSIDELQSLSPTEVKTIATSLKDFDVQRTLAYFKKYTPTPGFIALAKVEPVVKKESKTPQLFTTHVDFINKPQQWRNCKWALLQGEFKSGERSEACAIIASTCKGLAYDRELTRHMCLSALEKSWSKYGQGEFDEDELEATVLNQVFSQNWNGGQYTCAKPGWLQSYCDKLGEHACKIREDEKPCVDFDTMKSNFVSFASDYEKNIIKTGLESLDKNVMFSTSTLVGILGAPGSGKTSMAIQYLNYTSLNSIPSIFLSLDMGEPIIFAKLIQKSTGMDFREVLRIFRENPERAEKIIKDIKEQYKNVGFNFKSGLSVQDIKKVISDHSERTGQKTKLVIIDYLECLSGPYSDPIANTGMIANQLKDLANETGTCILLLLQTQKHSTSDISEALLTMRNVKGSSIIEQSMSVIVTLWREGYNPNTIKQDKYISFAVVKNRFGSLYKGDFSWDGVRGNISELTQEQEDQLQELLTQKKEAKKQKQNGNAFQNWND